MTTNNTEPIYVGIPDIQWSSSAITTANTAKDGTGTTVLIFTADATNGSYVEKITFAPLGTNIQTVARIFVNNGSSTATPANNTLIDNITLPAVTNSETAQVPFVTISLKLPLKAGQKLYITIGTTVASGYMVTASGGHYTRST